MLLIHVLCTCTEMDPIRKKRKELQDERLSEFAPPSSYQLPTLSKNQLSSSGGAQRKQDDSTDSSYGSQSQPNFYPPNPYFVLPGYPPPPPPPLPVFVTPPYIPGFIPTSSCSHNPSSQ